jgi:hypothetical protein
LAKRRPSPRKKAAKKPARKPARKAAAKKPATRAAASVLSLKQLRSDLNLAVARLSRQVESGVGPSAKFSSAQAVLSRWASEIDELCDPNEQELCGPTMDIPLN